MDLSHWADVAEIVGAATVAGGIVFAVAQLLALRRQRRELATIELGRSFENPDFARALRLVLSLPAGLDAAQLRARGPGIEDAAVLVSLTIESIGLMCQRGITDVDVVWDLMGGVVLTGWGNLCGWVADVRREQRNPKFDEWFEWLATDFERRRITRPAST
ncbi:MAG TPA: hypothetical protein VF055_07855 [Steroidobacteraceae bacterium]